MVFPLDIALLETADTAWWPLLLLAAVALMVVAFMIIELRRILRRRRIIDTPESPNASDATENRSERNDI
ncbi:hypothetical protein GCM10025789_12020 [Tessaracoccus lubricantis]|uniref:Uncharacterized protein n=1 Tax=Tessaracoccus lubricantis TaxID=545543 RepID=A0ABP9F8P5_9ACTN